MTEGGRWTRVAAAVVFGPDGRVLLAQRPEGRAYAGYWEFPGGKLESGESPRHALDRELREELGLEVIAAAPWLTARYVYPHARVEIDFFRVTRFAGEPVGHDGQAFAWQTPGDFSVGPLLPANSTVLKALLLPTVCGITCASTVGVERFLALAEAALARGLKLLQVREPTMPADQLAVLLGRLGPLAAARGATLVLNGTPAQALALSLPGVHLSAARLARARERPPLPLVGASCHNRSELEHAFALGLDYAFLGPVRETASHPGRAGIGWETWTRTVRPAPIPVFAIGGLRPADLDLAMSSGAHGIAMIRGAWGL